MDYIDISYTQTSPQIETIPSLPGWTNVEKITFRFFFIYFIIQAVPLDWRFYRDLFTINRGALYYRDLFNLARYAPHFFDPDDTFVNWAIVALIALVSTIIWTVRNQNQTDYSALTYWLRVVLRYRLAISVIAYGFIKLFPMQAPLPSISNLNTAYGDFTAWKLFSLSLGIVPSYESFLGLVEILGGLFLLNRRTTTIGTLIIIPFLGNIFVSNLAYEGGEAIYSLLLTSFALFLFTFDAIRLFRLVSLEKPTIPNRFRLVLTEPWQRYGRSVLKSAFIVFAILLYGYKTYAAYQAGGYQFPQNTQTSEPVLTGAAGLYDVQAFAVAGETIPYSKTDSKRWQDVVFENWNTISIKLNRPVRLETTNVAQINSDDANRRYELSGSAGRHYYSYQLDSTQHVLTLKNRNPDEQEILRGNYNVMEFRVNNKLIPYSPVDSVRWQEATFENWSTLTFKVNRAVPLDLSNGGGSPMRDINRTFELTGVGGGQRVFYYDADTANHVLYLQDKYKPFSERGERLSADLIHDGTSKKSKKNRKDKIQADNWIPATALASIGPEYPKIEPIARTIRRIKGIKAESKQEDGKRNHLILSYQTTNGSRVVLTGINENKDSIYVVLDRVNRPYALSKSTLNAGTY